MTNHLFPVVLTRKTPLSLNLRRSTFFPQEYQPQFYNFTIHTCDITHTQNRRTKLVHEPNTLAITQITLRVSSQ
jgi:hypothetical protein